MHRDKSESPFTRLAARCLFLKVYDPGFAKQTSRALPGAVRSKAFLSFHLTPERQSIMIRWGGRNGARLPAASPLVKLFKWQAPQAQSINQKRALRPELFLGPGQGSGRPALRIPCRKSRRAAACADCSQTPRAGRPIQGNTGGTRRALLGLLLLSVPWGCWNGGPRTLGLETTQIHLLSTLEARRRSQGVGRAAPSGGSRERPSCLSQLLWPSVVSGCGRHLSNLCFVPLNRSPWPPHLSCLCFL